MKVVPRTAGPASANLVARLTLHRADFKIAIPPGARHRTARCSRVWSWARNGHAEVSWRCPLLGEQQKTYASAISLSSSSHFPLMPYSNCRLRRKDGSVLLHE